MNRAVCQWTISNVQSHGQCPNSRRSLCLSVHAFLKHYFYLIKIVVKIVTAFTFGQFIRRIIYSKWLLWKMVFSSIKWLGFFKFKSLYLLWTLSEKRLIFDKNMYMYVIFITTTNLVRELNIKIIRLFTCMLWMHFCYLISNFSYMLLPKYW